MVTAIGDVMRRVYERWQDQGGQQHGEENRDCALTKRSTLDRKGVWALGFTSRGSES